MELNTARELYKGAVFFATKWLDLLAQGDFAAAASMIHHTKLHTWTPELLRAVIASYGASNDPNYVGGTKMKVTPISEASGPRPASRHEEEEVVFIEGHEYCFNHPSLPISVDVRGPETAPSDPWVGDLTIGELPLNGEWSDLSAVFGFSPIQGSIAYELQRLEVR